jgi:hypothetical protein
METLMYRRIALAFAVVALFALGASQAQAKTIHASATVKGTVTIDAGACTDGYSDQCPAFDGEGGSCTCAHTADGTITGGLGKGTVALDVTLDEQDDVDDNVGHRCRPIFGEVDVTITDPKKRAGSARVDVNGTLCDPITNDGPSIIEGGFAIHGCFIPSEEATTASGYGEVDGTLDSSDKLVLKLKSVITAPAEGVCE